MATTPQVFWASIAVRRAEQSMAGNVVLFLRKIRGLPKCEKPQQK
jgi:hypothetical protein